MSWNTSGFAVRAADVGDVMRAIGQGEARPGEAISWDEAGSSSLQGIAAARVGDWVYVFQSMLFIDPEAGMFPEDDGLFPPGIEAGLTALSHGGTALGFVFGGVSDTYALALWEGGERRRLRVDQEGETVMDVGEALAEESDWGEGADGEQFLIDLIEKRCADWDAVSTVDFRVYR